MRKNKNKKLEILQWERFSTCGIEVKRHSVMDSLLCIVPFLNVLVIAFIFFVFASETLILPGTLIDLPISQFTEGLLAKNPTVILQVVTVPGKSPDSILILDDGRYASSDEKQLARLPDALVGIHELNVIIDGSIPYKDAAEWLNRLREIGVRDINIVEKH